MTVPMPCDPRYLLNGRLAHGARADLCVQVEQGVQVAGPAVQQLVGEVGISADDRPLQLQKPARREKLRFLLSNILSWNCG